jgi:hypothetical protein
MRGSAVHTCAYRANEHLQDMTLTIEKLNQGPKTTLTIASSVLNRNDARALASSVLPTPVGPRNMKLAMGRLGSDRPALQHSNSRSTVSGVLPARFEYHLATGYMRNRTTAGRFDFERPSCLVHKPAALISLCTAFQCATVPQCTLCA